jgi:hypothetical protein
MNRSEILAKVGRALNKASTLDALTKARLLDVINNRHRQILSSPGCQGLRRRQFQFPSLAGRARYALHNGENIKHLRDLTNDVELSQRSLGVYRRYNPDPVQSPGTPDGFIQYGFEPVQTQPLDVGATLIFVVSTSAADTTQTVYLETPPTAVSNPVAISVTLNGLTPVALGSALYVDKLYLSAPAVGQVQLRVDTGTGTIISSIPAGQTATQWLAFYLDPTPSQSITYEIDCEFLITDLAQDTDTPDLPSDFHDLLETGAILDELAHLDDNRLVVMQRQYDRRLGELKLKLARMGSETGPRGRTSRLGPWAPTGSW